MRIVCATDLLPKSDPAVVRAGALADYLEADLTLLHVVVPDESQSVLDETLQDTLAQMKSRGRRPRWTARQVPNIAVRAGSPARLILNTLADSKAGLAILGPHRKRPVRDALEGTISEKVLAARLCPLLVVRNLAPCRYQRVLLALDVSSASASAIRATESLLLPHEADVQIVHAHEPPYQGMSAYAGVDFDTVRQYLEGWTGQAGRLIRDQLRSASANPERYEVVIAERPPVAAIRQAIASYRPDLLVMGTRGGGRVHRALLGSVANTVLREVICDVLIVPDGTFESARTRLHDQIELHAPGGEAHYGNRI